ncbi:biotin transporter BioY [Vampirovibrio chlorellavorus]|uniref:biotin transporter BioY n=1 Tax=Vampirovibrio chlorellavorus TaxID=758823 RepID=UPI0026EA943B|nr:biotin transporter BioY [Vampirovibrio chlorellavorus]
MGKDVKDGPIAIVNREASSEAFPEPEAESLWPADGSFLSPPRRTLLHRVSYPPRISLNGLLISLLCLLVVVMMGFIPVNLPSPLNIGHSVSSYDQLQLMRYTFQVPVALLVAAMMGPFMGTGIVFLFVALGLSFFPLFANGGGWQYVTQPGFGYLLGTLFAASILGRNFHKVFQKHDQVSRSLKLISQSLLAVLLVHGVGVLYLVGLALSGQLPWPELTGWALRLTVETAPYDCLSTFVFLCLVRQFRLALWLVLY